MIQSGKVSFESDFAGNITGYSFIEPEIIGKWINLLGDIKPALTRVTLMFNPNTAPYYDRFTGPTKQRGCFWSRSRSPFSERR